MLLGGYALSVLLALTGVYFERKNPNIEAIFKTAGTLTLAVLAFLAPGSGTLIRVLVAIGLLASAVGDFLLAWDDKKFFIPGLGSFAGTHLFYTIAFFIIVGMGPKNIFFTLMGSIMGLGLIGVQILLIFPKVRFDKVMLWPVTIYSILLSSMLITAYSTAQVGIIIGATLFIASDCAIARHKFYKPVRSEALFILMPYFLGQMFIVASLWI